MLRESARAHPILPEPHFRWRGGEITRLEAFTDAVIVFANATSTTTATTGK